MSEDEIQNTRQFAVSAHDFVRFLEAKTLDSPCPACSFQGWTVIGSSKTEARIASRRPSVTGRNQAKFQHLQFIAMSAAL
ncbi:hypothetical protein ACFQD2_00420 [Pseudomonas lini]